MYRTGSTRSVLQRTRLTLTPGLGAGNFFRHAYRVAGRRQRARPALYTAGTGDLTEWSLDRMHREVRHRAAFHAARGVGPGTRVGVYTRNGMSGLLQHVAITSLGGVTVLANPNMAGDLAAGYFARTGASTVVGDPGLTDGLEGLPDGTTLLDVRDTTGPGPVPAPYRHRPDDLVLVSHSSGTTGVPKPAGFTHGSFFAGRRRRLWTFPSAHDDRMVSALPQSHSAGLSYVSLALLLGLPTLMLDDPGDLAGAMNRLRPTVVIGFPGTLAALDPADLSPGAARTVRTWMGMGDASHERHIRPLLEVGGGDRTDGGPTYVDGLGSSEMGMVLFRVEHRRGTADYGRLIGRPVGVVQEAVVLDERGTPQPDGRAGLLGVRTPSVTPGYVDAPELTELARSGRYLLTGDVVRRDGLGNFYHLDRTPDVIATADGPVHSLPVEEVVLSVTGALDAAVVAVDDPAGDRSVAAAVVLFGHDGSGPAGRDPAGLLAACNTALAGHGLPGLRALVVAADRAGLPVGVTGKVLKRRLREQHADLLRRPPAPGTARCGVTGDPAPADGAAR